MLRVAILTGALTFSALAWCSQAPTTTKPISTRNQQQGVAKNATEAKSDQRGTSDSPLIVKLANTGKTDAEAEQERKAIENNTTISQVIAVATVILAAFTIILAFTGICQARISSKTAKRQLRAYLSADETPDDGGRQLTVSKHKARALLCITNHGQTPAYRVEMKANVEYLPYPHDENFKFQELKYDGPIVINPGQSHFLDAKGVKDYADRQIKTDYRKETRDLPHGSLRWHVYGYVTYTDAFGNRHHIRFCYYLSWNNGTDEPPGWYNCHSDTDDKFS